MPQPQQVEPVVQAQQEVVLVNMNYDADEVVRNFQQQNFGAHNNIVNLVETIMAQNDLNIGLIGQTLFLLCQSMSYKLSFPGVGKYLSSQSLLVIPVSLLSNTLHVI